MEASEAIFQLLISPVRAYSSNLLILLNLPSSISVTKAETGFLGGHFSELLFSQHYLIRRQVAQEVAKTALKASISSDFIISSVDGVDLILGELCDSIVRDQKDGDLFGSKEDNSPDKEISNNFKLEWDNIVEEQCLVSRLIQILKSTDCNANAEFKVNL